MNSIRRLGVNIDHVATLRQARRSEYPDPVAAAAAAELAGADQITCHLRIDRRHIQDEDLPRLRDIVQTQLNIEISPSPEMLRIVCSTLSLCPGRHRVTLVPENPEEVTTEGGLDVASTLSSITAATNQLRDHGILVSLFVDPELKQLEHCAIDGVDMIELNTDQYSKSEAQSLERLCEATNFAAGMGLEVAAGHGLTHHNLPLLVANAPEIVEYNIGHSIVSRAVFVGFDTAVRDLISIIR